MSTHYGTITLSTKSRHERFSMSIPDWFNAPYMQRAFAITSLFHEDRNDAKTVIVQAVKNFDSKTDAIVKYERALERFRSVFGKSRKASKLMLHDQPLLQRLLYNKSSELEKQRRKLTATDDSQSQERMTIRYLRSIMILLLDHSFPYAGILLCQLTYSYTGVQTRLIAPWSDSDESRNDEKNDQRRRAKGTLMAQLQNEFRLSVVNPGGQEDAYFDPYFDQMRLWPLVRHCLDLFVPWKTNHISGDWAFNDELHRFHSLICPKCFENLIAALAHFDYLSPESSLRIPRLVCAEQAGNNRPQDDDPGPQNTPPDSVPQAQPLSPEEMQEILDRIAHDARRRAVVQPGACVVKVDGDEVGHFNASQTNSLEFDVSEDAHLIEVHSCEVDGEVLLATHILSRTVDGNIASSAGSRRIGVKHKFVFRVIGAPDVQEAKCKIRYTRLAFLPTFTPLPRFAYTVILLAAVVGWLGRTFIPLGRSPSDREQKLTTELAAERDARQGIQRQLSELKGGVPAFGLSPLRGGLKLGPGKANSRGQAEALIRITIPSQISIITLNLAVDDDRFPHYRATLQPLERNQDLLTQSGLTASLLNGRWVVSWTLLSETVAPDHGYLIQLYGTGDDGADHKVGPFGLWVEKK
jgi:hypothetical protein